MCLSTFLTAEVSGAMSERIRPRPKSIFKGYICLQISTYNDEVETVGIISGIGVGVADEECQVRVT